MLSWINAAALKPPSDDQLIEDLDSNGNSFFGNLLTSIGLA